jgi:hypothetical protein
MYWGVEASVQYGGANGSASVNILSTNSGIGIFDTGTTMISLSTGKLPLDGYQISVQSHNTYVRCASTLRQCHWCGYE